MVAFAPIFGIIFHDGVYWRKHMWGPSSGKLETKNTSIFILASCRSCVLPNLLVALSSYKLALCILCNYFLALYCLMVFIHETHLVAKEKLKFICFHSWFLQVVSAAQCVSCSKQEQFTTMPWAIPICSHFLALYCLMVFISMRLETKKAWVVILADCVCHPMC